MLSSVLPTRSFFYLISTHIDLICKMFEMVSSTVDCIHKIQLFIIISWPSHDLANFWNTSGLCSILRGNILNLINFDKFLPKKKLKVKLGQTLKILVICDKCMYTPIFYKLQSKKIEMWWKFFQFIQKKSKMSPMLSKWDETFCGCSRWCQKLIFRVLRF
jgi:hypothetical protein